MSKSKKCSCGCSPAQGRLRKYRIGTQQKTLADLPVGSFATILQVMPEWRGRRKFADVGLIPGTELLMEAHAPFGGLLRIRLLETSMALHRDDAACILIKEEEPAR